MKKGMFTGWKDVFAFTFFQNIKTKAFKTAFIGIGILFFAVFFGINMVAGLISETDDEDKDSTTPVTKVFVIDESGIKDLKLSYYKDNSRFTNPPEIIVASYENDTSKNVKELISNQYSQLNESEIIIHIYKEQQKESEVEYFFEIYLGKDSLVKKGEARDIAEELEDCFNKEKLLNIGININELSIIKNDVQVSMTDVKEGTSIAKMLLKMFVPMIFSLIVYLLILLYGQSIGKIIISEKSSKLMEMLLINIKPYAIILGKILAMYTIAVLQIAVWVILSICGYIAGDFLAGKMFSKYSNPVTMAIDLIQKDSAGAFSAEAIIVCVLALLIGFFMYCVLSGLITSNITKPEELNNGTAIFQMIVVIGFMASYFIPLSKLEGGIIMVLRFIPVTSAFMLPSDALIGNISFGAGIISIVIMIITTVVMILFTGKIYKKKLF